MLAEERFSEILKIIAQKKTVSVQELTELLETSESTIRRDLTALHKRGKIIKVHGGATAVEMEYQTKDATVSERQDLNIEEKVLVAKYAAQLIDKKDFVYIDAGTSTGFLIDYIVEKDAVYVTNAISHARKLSQKGCKVFLLGGELKETTEAIVGAEAMESLDRYHFTKGFFGANGIHKERGFTTPDVNEAMIKGKAFKQCKEKYVMADSSKLNQISSVKFGEFGEAVILTTAVKEPALKKCGNVVEVSKL